MSVQLARFHFAMVWAPPFDGPGESDKLCILASAGLLSDPLGRFPAAGLLSLVSFQQLGQEGLIGPLRTHLSDSPGCFCMQEFRPCQSSCFVACTSTMVKVNPAIPTLPGRGPTGLTAAAVSNLRSCTGRLLRTVAGAYCMYTADGIMECL